MSVFFDTPERDAPMARSLGCGATFDSVRALRRGHGHLQGCDQPGEVF
jgi:hypothetical protein